MLEIILDWIAHLVINNLAFVVASPVKRLDPKLALIKNLSVANVWLLVWLTSILIKLDSVSNQDVGLVTILATLGFFLSLTVAPCIIWWKISMLTKTGYSPLRSFFAYLILPLSVWMTVALIIGKVFF